MIKGTLADTSLPALLIAILKLRKTGRLSLYQDANRGYTLYFEKGKLRYGTSLRASMGLAVVLLQKDLVTADFVENAEKTEDIKPFEQQLHEQKLLSGDALKSAMLTNMSKIIAQLPLLLPGEFIFLDGNPAFPYPDKKMSILSMIINKSRQLTDLDLILPLLEPIDAIPQLNRKSAGFKTLLKIKLNAHEGFILSRIDGMLDFNKIFTFCGPNRLETARFLYLLLVLDILQYQVRGQSGKSEMQKQLERAYTLFKGAGKSAKSSRDSQPKPKAAAAVKEKPEQAKTPGSTGPIVIREQLTPEQKRQNLEIMREIRAKKEEFKKKNYFQILEVSHDADSADVKRAYFKLAKKFHPDNFFRTLPREDLAEVKDLFEIIKKAYDTLSDSNARFKYAQTVKSKPHVVQMMNQDEDTARQRISAEYQYKQALICIKQREYGRALEFLKAAVEFDGENPVFLAKYAEIEFFHGRNTAAAEKALRSAIAKKGDEGLFHLLLAKILIKRGRLDHAEKAAKKALLLIPESPEVRKILLDIKAKKNQDDNRGKKKGFLNKLFK